MTRLETGELACEPDLGRSEPVVLAAAAPALLHAVHERTAGVVALTALLAGPAAVDDGEAPAGGGGAATLGVGRVTGRRGSLASEDGETHGRGDQHDQEAEDADDGLLGDHAGHQHDDATDEDDAGQDGLASGGLSQGGAAQGGGELGVLLDERALHLLEQSQLFLRERHGCLPVGTDQHRRHKSLFRSV